MNELLQNYLAMPEMRKALLTKFQVTHEENWQKQGTPETVVTGMVDLVKDTPELLYVVLFNHEFLEELVFVRKVPKERVMFMADCKSEADLSMGVYGVKTFELPQSCRDPKQAIELLVSKIEKAFYNGGPMPKTNNLVVYENPPFHKEDGGGTGKSSVPIYNLFVECCLGLSPRYLCAITPSRWMVGGRGLDRYREKMMKDKHLRSIQHFPGSRDIFKEVNIEFGVSYFLWDLEYNGKCEFNGVFRHLDEYDVILSDNESSAILDRVIAGHRGLPFINNRVYPAKPFGVRTNFKDWQPAGVKCFAKGREIKYVNPSVITDACGIANLWKVCTSQGRGEGNTQVDKDGRTKVISTFFVAEPGAICTETYIVMGAFTTEEEALGFLSYVNTKFFRFLLNLRLSGPLVNKDKFSWVPDLGSYVTAPTDEQLFKQFGLSAGEIEYINKRIK